MHTPGRLGFFFFSSRRRHTIFDCDWISDVCSSDLITALALHAILDWRDASGMAFLLYPVWLGCAYAVYRRFMPDLFVLAGGCLSVILAVITFLARHLLQRGGYAAAFLLIALAGIVM